MKYQSALLLAVSMSIFSSAYASGQHGGNHEHSEQGHDNETSAVGQPALASQAIKTIKVTTHDSMKYTFSPELKLSDGEVVTFVITNSGKITHEFSIGDAEEQKSHQEMMRKMPNMTHSDGNSITLKPGETREITWKFKKGAEVVFACNIPGHFEAGMFAKSIVENRQQHHSH
jgi:uncharacterized cupredoxin-like copper-binding protein